MRFENWTDWKKTNWTNRNRTKLKDGQNWDLKTTGQIEKRHNWKSKIENWTNQKWTKLKDGQNWELKTRQIEKKNKIENTDWQNWELDKIENGQTWKYRLTELFKNWTKLKMDRIGNLTKLN